jgi:hypothetical protein
VRIKTAGVTSSDVKFERKALEAATAVACAYECMTTFIDIRSDIVDGSAGIDVVGAPSSGFKRRSRRRRWLGGFSPPPPT